MHAYLSLDIITSSKLTVFLERRFRKTVRFSEQIMSADKYPSIFSRQMKAIVYLYWIYIFLRFVKRVQAGTRKKNLTKRKMKNLKPIVYRPVS